MALTRSDDPLVWIDCEMTGLDHNNDQILSISCFITTSTLTLIEPNGYHAIISTPKEVLVAMDEWCVKTHTGTGLVQQCLDSDTTASTVAEQLLNYIKKHIPTPRRALLAGNSVHVDKLFLLQSPWRPVIEWLHYRILDVSAIKESVRRWCHDEILSVVPMKKEVHSAHEDVLESIEEARCYMRLFGRLGS